MRTLRRVLRAVWLFGAILHVVLVIALAMAHERPALIVPALLFGLLAVGWATFYSWQARRMP